MDKMEGDCSKISDFFSMVMGLMNKLEDIGKIYRKTLAILAPSMEEYGTKLAPYSISCALKNVILQSGRVQRLAKRFLCGCEKFLPALA